MVGIVFYVGAGSCVGGVARYLLSRAIGESTSSVFPWGTLAVNLLGCLLIGVIYGWLDRGHTLNEGLKAFLTVGFCGGFTTFSTFIYESERLWNSSGVWLMAVYAGVSLSLGLLCVFAAQAAMRAVS